MASFLEVVLRGTVSTLAPKNPGNEMPTVKRADESSRRSEAFEMLLSLAENDLRTH